MEDFFNSECQAIGFRQAVNFGIAKPSPEKGGQLSETVKAFIVHFSNDDPLETGKDVLETIWQRMQMTEMQRRNVMATLPRLINGFTDGTEG